MCGKSSILRGGFPFFAFCSRCCVFAAPPQLEISCPEGQSGDASPTMNSTAPYTNG